MAEEKKDQAQEESQAAQPAEGAAPAAGNGAAPAPETFRAVLGEKVGMTQVFTAAGELKAVTVVKAGPCPVVQVKTKDGKDGYSSVQIGFGEKKEKNFSRPLAGHWKKAGLPKPLRWLREFRVADADASKFAVGQVVSLAGRFSAGDYVDVRGLSKGRGFAGAMKRHNFGGLPASHGASDKERSPGSLTSRRSLGRVVKGQRMAGHLGVEAITVQKIEVVQVEADSNLIYLDGSVPGARGSFVVLTETVKNRKRRKDAPKAKGPKKDKMGNIITEAPKKAKK